MRVLIIEDEKGVALLLRRFLEPLATEILEVSTMAEAFGIISGADEIDIITLDLGLPDSGVSSSLQEIRQIRSKRPGSLVIVVTGQDIPALEAQALNHGADGVLFKQSPSFTAQGFLTFMGGLLKEYLSKPQDHLRSVAILEKVAQKLASIKALQT